MRRIIDFIMRRRRRNASPAKMLLSPGLRLSQGEKGRNALKSAQTHITHRPQAHPGQDLAPLPKKK